MISALLAGLFFVLIVVFIRREAHHQRSHRRHRQELAEKQKDLEKAEHRARKLLSSFGALYDSKPTTTGTSSAHALEDFLVQSVGPVVGMETVVLFRWDPLTSDYRCVAARGLSPQQVRTTRVNLGEGVVGKTAQTGIPVTVLNAITLRTDENSYLKAPYLIYPLGTTTPARGIMVLSSPIKNPIDEDTARLAELLAKHIGVRLGNIELQETCQNVYLECLNALTQAVESKDALGQGHAAHCREWAREMALAMHLPAALSEQMEYAAMLHDVGKLGISDALLQKPGPLSTEEYQVVKNHPVLGHRMLRQIDFLKAVAPIVLYHHEWVNGEGYPEGLVGEEIPLGARMVAIIDAWDAMTTDQPYRKAMPRNAAIAELRQQAGTQFDPKLVDVFLLVLEKKVAPLPQITPSNA